MLPQPRGPGGSREPSGTRDKRGAPRGTDGNARGLPTAGLRHLLTRPAGTRSSVGSSQIPARQRLDLAPHEAGLPARQEGLGRRLRATDELKAPRLGRPALPPPSALSSRCPERRRKCRGGGPGVETVAFPARDGAGTVAGAVQLLWTLRPRLLLLGCRFGRAEGAAERTGRSPPPWPARPALSLQCRPQPLSGAAWGRRPCRCVPGVRHVRGFLRAESPLRVFRPL